MPNTNPVAVRNLKLDLANFRTIRQPTELSAVEAMISTSPDRFWALLESLLNDGYLPTESIIVLRQNGDGSGLVVKEGNRRIAALKLLHGMLPHKGLPIPQNLAAAIKNLPAAWKTENEFVPCTIFDANDASKVDRIVSLAHGKGEKAGRDQWNAVARARHNRDANRASEPALDLLEKYLTTNKVSQRTKWAGAYPLSVLAEAIKRLAPRLGLTNSSELANRYPGVPHAQAVDAILLAIGMEELGFEGIRDKKTDFATPYGIPGEAEDDISKGKSNTASSTPSKPNKPGSRPRPSPHQAFPLSDPRSIRRLLKDLVPKGKRREKLVALRDEAVCLDHRKTPLAFCFVVRSMFEISAKAYCLDHQNSGGPALTKKNGEDKKLADLLREITSHLTKNKADKERVKLLHGAITELAKTDGLLSVTSMNQLIHNPRFSILSSDIGALFGNVFPLLEEMNG